MILQFNHNHINSRKNTSPSFQGLNRYLSKNFVEAGISKISGKLVTNEEAVLEVLEKFPKSRRFVGNLPPDWIDKIPKGNRKETIQQIQDIFSEFAEKLCTPMYTAFNKDENFVIDFLNKLQKTLKLVPNIEFIKEGSLGKAFKLEIGNKNYVLKTFHSNTDPCYRQKHGKIIETSRTPYTEKNGYKSFADFYLGKIASKEGKDGFILTGFEDKNKNLTQQEEIKRLLRLLKAPFTSPDIIIYHNARQDLNMIGRKVIDLGSLKLLDETFNKMLVKAAEEIGKYCFNTKKSAENKQKVLDKILETYNSYINHNNKKFIASIGTNLVVILERLSDLIKDMPITESAKLADIPTLQKPKSLFARAIGFLLPQKLLKRVLQEHLQ